MSCIHVSSFRSFAGARDGFAGFPISGAAAFSFTFIPELFAFRKCEFDLYFTVLEIHSGGDKREAALLGLAYEFANFLFVHQ